MCSVVLSQNPTNYVKIMLPNSYGKILIVLLCTFAQIALSCSHECIRTRTDRGKSSIRTNEKHIFYKKIQGTYSSEFRYYVKPQKHVIWTLENGTGFLRVFTESK